MVVEIDMNVLTIQELILRTNEAENWEKIKNSRQSTQNVLVLLKKVLPGLK